MLGRSRLLEKRFACQEWLTIRSVIGSLRCSQYLRVMLTLILPPINLSIILFRENKIKSSICILYIYAWNAKESSWSVWIFLSKVFSVGNNSKKESKRIWVIRRFKELYFICGKLWSLFALFILLFLRHFLF